MMQPLESRLLMAAAPTAAYTVVELPRLATTPSNSSVSASAINESNYVAGASGAAAVVWRIGPTGKAVPTALPNPPGFAPGADAFSGANDVNDAPLAQLVGSARTGARINESAYVVHPILWQADAAGTFSATDLGTLGHDIGVATDLNDNGVVVGQLTTFNISSSVFIWDAANGMRDLHNLLPADSGWTLWEPRDINNSGRIIGWGYLNGAERGFRMDLNGAGPATITALPGLTAENRNSPNALNSFGHIVGSSYVRTVPDAYWGPRAVYDAYILKGEVMTNLGTLGDRGSFAAGVNDSGAAVGTSFTSVKGSSLTPFNTPTPTLWKSGTITNLNKVLPAKTPWLLQRAHDINNSGVILVEGTGTSRTNSSLGRLLLVPTAVQASTAVVTVAPTVASMGAASTGETTLLFSDEPVNESDPLDGEPILGLLA
jgi:uncharacterized membrane protein